MLPMYSRSRAFGYHKIITNNPYVRSYYPQDVKRHYNTYNILLLLWPTYSHTHARIITYQKIHREIIIVDLERRKRVGWDP